MSDKFYFYSKSADVKPGKGSNEIINEPQDPRYSSLPKNFRKILSNFWIAPFTLDGHRWNSVEHYYHAQKFMSTNPEWAIEIFSLDGKENQNIPENDVRQIAFDPALSKSAGGKGGNVKKLNYKRPKNVQADPLFFSSASAGIPGHPTWTRQDVAFFKAMCAKFSQHEDLKEVLQNTGDAELWHIMSRTTQTKWPRFWYLERIRELHRQGRDCLFSSLNNEPVSVTNASSSDDDDVEEEDSVPEYHDRYNEERFCT